MYFLFCIYLCSLPRSVTVEMEDTIDMELCQGAIANVEVALRFVEDTGKCLYIE